MIAVRPARPDDAERLSNLHIEGFDDAWSAVAIADLLRSTGVFGFIAELNSKPAGFILCRQAADEAEVLTIVTAPAFRRRGIGDDLLHHGLAAALAGGATSVFLEVAEDNPGAEALYRAQGFGAVGRRPGYYLRASGAVAALIMRRDLNR